MPKPDGILTDLVKDMDDEGLEEIRKLIRKWWLKREVPQTLTVARVVSLYKKGDPEVQENYRPISLLNAPNMASGQAYATIRRESGTNFPRTGWLLNPQIVSSTSIA